jgi:hypothetical protein
MHGSFTHCVNCETKKYDNIIWSRFGWCKVLQLASNFAWDLVGSEIQLCQVANEALSCSTHCQLVDKKLLLDEVNSIIIVHGCFPLHVKALKIQLIRIP